MNLHEQYETLVKRGMPPVPRLMLSEVYKQPGTMGPDFIPMLVEWQWTTGRDHPESKFIEIHPDEARDLITMHALRWLSTVRQDSTPRIHKPTLELGYYEHDDDLRFVMRGVKQGSAVYEGQHIGPLAEAILDAILAATEHLEPQ